MHEVVSAQTELVVELRLGLNNRSRYSAVKGERPRILAYSKLRCQSGHGQQRQFEQARTKVCLLNYSLESTVNITNSIVRYA